MQPDGVDFAAVWPAANGRGARKVILPCKCTVADASETLDQLAYSVSEAIGNQNSDEISTLVVGSFCVFSTAAGSLPALIVVGSKTWAGASDVAAFIRRIQAALARNPADFGYWQLRALAWQDEQVSSRDESSVTVMPPRLVEARECEEQDINGLEDEDELSSADVDDSSAEPRPSVEGSSPNVGTTTRPISGQSFRLASQTGDPEVNSAVEGDRSLADGEVAMLTTASAWNDPNLNESSNESAQRPVEKPLLPTEGPAEAVASRGSQTPSDHERIATSSSNQTAAQLVAALEQAGPWASALANRHQAVAGDANMAVASSASPSESVSTHQNHLRSGSAHSTPSSSTASSSRASLEARPFTNDADAAHIPVPRKQPGRELSVDATDEMKNDHARDETSGGDSGLMSAAVSEDLAYIHRGAALQSYAITGSILVAVPVSGAVLCITDKLGHIASAVANPIVAEAVTSDLSCRRFSCRPNAHSEQPPGLDRPKYVPAVMYRCSSAVREMPVRVSSRLRMMGSAVIVWAQLIANPQLSQPLQGASVLVHLPFSPRDQDTVESEPPASWDAGRQVLEWALPGSIKPGDKLVMQARLAVQDSDMKATALPQTAPAMVKCHIADSTFSSVDIAVLGAASGEEGGEAGRVTKRCRVQCRQQG